MTSKKVLRGPEAIQIQYFFIFVHLKTLLLLKHHACFNFCRFFAVTFLTAPNFFLFVLV